MRAIILIMTVLVLPRPIFSRDAAGQTIRQDSVGLPRFEVASIRQNHSETAPQRLAFTSDGVTIENVSLLNVVRAAYGKFNSMEENFIGMPDWAKTEKYDIEAKVSGADAEAFQRLNLDQRQLIVQTLLADRFGLRVHREMRQQPVYMLVAAKDGAKLKDSTPAERTDPGGRVKKEQNRLVGTNAVVSQLASALTSVLGRMVMDQAGLTGKYDFTLTWAPEGAALSSSASDEATVPDSQRPGPSIFTAIQEQLGLRLQPGKAPVECLVIDHLERPSPN